MFLVDRLTAPPPSQHTSSKASLGSPSSQMVKRKRARKNVWDGFHGPGGEEHRSPPLILVMASLSPHHRRLVKERGAQEALGLVKS